MTIEDALDRFLLETKVSLEACVVVGGTLINLHREALAAAIDRGVSARFVFPPPNASWLSAYIQSADVSLAEYGGRISRNADRLRALGTSVQVRWSIIPVTTWFAIGDRSAAAHKPVDFVEYAPPVVTDWPDAVRYYSHLFDMLWAEASVDHQQLNTPPPHPRRSLRIFICHSRVDGPSAAELYDTFVSHGFEPWLDVKSLRPGQEWRLEVERAVKRSDVIVVCLSRGSVDRRGYMQREITMALDIAQEQPQGVIFVMPVRLDECALPDRLAHLHTVDVFTDVGRSQLLRALSIQGAVVETGR